MARITVEDCLEKVTNRFHLVRVASKRARQIMNGKEPTLEWDNDKATVLALREIADKKIDLTEVWENIVSHAQKYQPAEDADIDDEQAVPINENATQNKPRKLALGSCSIIAIM